MGGSGYIKNPYNYWYGSAYTNGTLQVRPQPTIILEVSCVESGTRSHAVWMDT